MVSILLVSLNWMNQPFLSRITLFGLVFTFFFSFATASALEHIRFMHRGQERNEEGRIILEAPDGIVFEARDGQYYVIPPGNIIARRSDDRLFVPFTKAEMIERLKEDFPPEQGFHYLDMFGPFIIVYTTSRDFANRYGTLLERLYG